MDVSDGMRVALGTEVRVGVPVGIAVGGTITKGRLVRFEVGEGISACLVVFLVSVIEKTANTNTNAVPRRKTHNQIERIDFIGI
jgi:hypothetical protein